MSYDKSYCIESGGQFYDNYTDSDFHRCLSGNENGVDITTEISLQYYPICAGASCNVYEIQAAVKQTIAADLDYGSLGRQIRQFCGLPEKLESASNARFNVGYLDIIFISFAMGIWALALFKKFNAKNLT